MHIVLSLFPGWICSHKQRKRQRDWQVTNSHHHLITFTICLFARVRVKNHQVETRLWFGLWSLSPHNLYDCQYGCMTCCLFNTITWVFVCIIFCFYSKTVFLCKQSFKPGGLFEVLGLNTLFWEILTKDFTKAKKITRLFKLGLNFFYRFLKILGIMVSKKVKLVVTNAATHIAFDTVHFCWDWCGKTNNCGTIWVFTSFLKRSNRIHVYYFYYLHRISTM